MKKKFLGFFNVPANVAVLGFVSFLTDVSSDMIYPLLPLFLVQYLGASLGFVGLVEGIAESTAAFFTLISGLFADRVKDRSRIILGGYSLSSLARPLAALAWAPWVIAATRFFDRVGKGIRTAPRDALIADSVSPQDRGRAFGFQRSLDNAGSVAGPLAATFLITMGMTNLRHVFAMAAIPGILAVLLIVWKVREVLPPNCVQAGKKFELTPPRGKLRGYLIIFFIFVISTSSDAFLLLRAGQLGVSQALLPMLWLVFNAVKVLTVFPLGVLSDRIGRGRVILAGWFIYALVYLGFALASETWHVWVLFIIFAFYYGFTEGSARALLVDLAPENGRGQAFGWYYFLIGAGSLPASLIFGWIWQRYGAAAAFYTEAGISAVAAFLFLWFLKGMEKAGLNKE